ncbi:MAG: sulfatase [Planctomycetota bacterium]|nr:sulfatase [Planctomycetota bacterium]
MRALNALLTVAAALALPVLVAGEGAARRPNILYIMSDDHAAHAISAYGSVINKTPNIDRLATQGMRFNHCYVTNSICTPSRAAIITGKYSHINGVPVFNRFDGSQPTLAKYLQAAGYHTGMIGKWHLGSDPTGFDYWNILPGQGVYHDPGFIEMGQRNKHTGYVTDLIADFSIEFIKNRPKDKPFFLMCHNKAPHRPWDPDDKHAKMYDDVELPEPATFNDDYATRCPAATEATMTIDRHLTRRDLKYSPPGEDKGPARKGGGIVDLTMTVTGKDGKEVKLTGEALKKWKYQKYIKDYLRCIASVDDNVGRLLDYLDKEGLAENTMVIYTSDQGFFLGDHTWFDKRFMYEESLKMPFLVRYPPLIKSGSTSDGMILNVDFAPTLLDLAGEKVPADMQGRSFLPLLKGETPKDWRTSMYYRYYHYPQDHRVQPHYGVRTLTHKLIYFNKLDQWELYDLEKDPHELKNVYGDPANADLVKQLKEEMYRLKKELKDEDQFQDKQPAAGV